jgi:hypothetical protein
MKYIKKILEIFNTKNYTWKSYSLGKKAEFIIEGDIYYVIFDEIYPEVYNHYFYLERENIKYFDIIKRNDNKSFEIFSNVKHILDDFTTNNPYIEFLGFSSSEKERHDLYILYSQYIRGRNNLNKFISKNSNYVDYYIIYNEDMGELLLNKYLEKFIIDNDFKKS